MDGGTDASAEGGEETPVAGAVNPTSGGTGGGRSLPRRAGKEMIPAITAAAMAAARPTLCHLIWRPDMSR